jgi:hypothetical protein
MRALAALALLFVIACGDDDRTIDLPFEDPKPVSQLTAAELQQLCRITLDKAREQLGNTTCAVQGLIAQAEGEGTCAAKQQSCLQEQFGAVNCDEAGQSPPQCAVTVGQLETCFNETMALIEGKIPTISCSTPLSELQQLQGQELEFEPAPSCDVLDQCEGLNLGFEMDDVAETTQ